MTRSTPAARCLLIFAVAATGYAGMAASAQQTGQTENRAIDCSQYPEGSADLYHAQFVESCREFALAMGYRDARLVPMDSLEEAVELADKPPTCPKVEPGNLGFYCVGMDKQPR